MTDIDLSKLEAGDAPDGDYEASLITLQERLQHLQCAHIVHGRRTMIVFEGWDAAGKGGAICRLSSGWDPRYFQVYPIAAPTVEEKNKHFLWRFWAKLPGVRDIHIFDRSWYGRVLVERVEGFCSEAEWKRGYDEINEFEAQQIDIGTNIIKIFLHVTQKTQDKRLQERMETPHKRWKVTAEDFRNREKRGDYLAAIEAMFKQTNTRWAPWKAIDGNNKKAARLAVLSHIADRLEEALPKDFPELDAPIAMLAKQTFGG